MAIKVFSTKFIGAITTGGSVIVGSGFGIKAAVNAGSRGSGQNIQELADGGGINYDYLNIDGLSEGVKTYLKKSDDFVVEKTKTTNVILARVADIPTTQNLTGKSLKCAMAPSEEFDCKLLLIKPNLTHSNIGKVLYSSLKEISSTTTESPKDSIVVVEFTGHNKNLDAFKNKVISVKENTSEILKVNFDQVLFKQEINVGKEKIDVLVPLKKNIVTYFAYSFNSYKLFEKNPNINSLSCYWKSANGPEGSDKSKIQTFDDGCRIIAIDYVQSGHKKLTGLQRLLDSKTPINKELAGKEGESVYFKVEIDMNKFYHVNLNESTDFEGIYVKPSGPLSVDVVESSFYISQIIEDGKVKGKTDNVIVKYTGKTSATTVVDKKAYCMLDATFDTTLDTTKEADSLDEKKCRVHEITQPSKITKENFESINIKSKVIESAATLKKDGYYVFSIVGPLATEELTNKKPIYLFTTDNMKWDVEEEGSKTVNATTRHEFEIVGLIAGPLIPTGHTTLITDIQE